MVRFTSTSCKVCRMFSCSPGEGCSNVVVSSGIILPVGTQGTLKEILLRLWVFGILNPPVDWSSPGWHLTTPGWLNNNSHKLSWGARQKFCCPSLNKDGQNFWCKCTSRVRRDAKNHFRKVRRDAKVFIFLLCFKEIWMVPGLGPWYPRCRSVMIWVEDL